MLARVLLTLCLGQNPPPDPSPSDFQIKLTGDVQVVKVDQVIIVKKDVSVVNRFPLKLEAPPGAAFYSWSVPTGVTYFNKGDTIEITNAPKGSMTVGTVATYADGTVDKDNKVRIVFSNRYSQVSFNIGDVPVTPAPPVTPPNPPPPPPPNPPNPPAPVDLGADAMGFAKLAKAEAEKVADLVQRAKAPSLADNFESISAKLAATASMEVDDAMEELKTKNQATLPAAADRTAWGGFFLAWKTQADQLNTTTLTTRQGYVTALSDTAKGLRAASLR